jgi:hypothetical protein
VVYTAAVNPYHAVAWSFHDDRGSCYTFFVFVCLIVKEGSVIFYDEDDDVVTPVVK